MGDVRVLSAVGVLALVIKVRVVQRKVQVGGRLRLRFRRMFSVLLESSVHIVIV